MKKWILALAMLLLLTACGKDAGPTLQYEPYGLEIEYGDSGVTALVGNHSWSSGDYAAEVSDNDPREHLSQVPFVNETKDKTMKLKFAKAPDSCEVRVWSSADGYTQAETVPLTKEKLTMPRDGASYLYEVRGVWTQQEGAAAWGECCYYFRYLPADATGEQERETTLFRVMQMEPTDLFGVVMTNHLDVQQKSSTSEEDKRAVLDYLKTYLATAFVPATAGPIDYELRLACTDGTELQLAYGSDGVAHWLVVNGTCYEAEVMDLYSLWKALPAAAESLEPASAYLQTTEEFPGAAWGETYRHGYVRSLDDLLVFDEMLWIDDSTQPNGYLLEAGEAAQTLPLSENCEFWVLEDHYAPWCQVTAEQLLQWNEAVDWEILYRIYVADGAVIAVCEAYIP